MVSDARDAAPAIQHDVLKMAGQNGDATVTMNAAGLPLSHPAISTFSGVVVISGETMALLHAHTQMSSLKEVHNHNMQVPFHT